MPTVAESAIITYQGRPAFTWRWKGDDYWHTVDLTTETSLCWEDEL